MAAEVIQADRRLDNMEMALEKATIEVMALPKPKGLRKTGRIPVKSKRWVKTHNLAMCTAPEEAG